MLPSKINIFVLSSMEDDSVFINSTLRNNGLTAITHWSKDKSECINFLNKQKTHLVFFRSSNFSAQDENFIDQLRQVEKSIPIIIINNELSEHTLAASVQLNANDLVTLRIADRLLMVTMRELSNHLKVKELQSLRAQTHDYKKKLNQLQASSSTPFVIIQDGIIVDANPAAEKLLQSEDGDSIETTTILDYVRSDDQEIFKNLLRAMFKSRKKQESININICNRSASDCSLTQCDLYEHQFDDEYAIKVEFFSEKTESEEALELSIETENTELSIIEDKPSMDFDLTTRLYSRKQFIDQCNERLNQGLTSGIITMLYISIDRIKQLARTFDILNIDRVYEHVGNAIINTTAAEDIYGRFSDNAFTLLTFKGSMADVESWVKHFQGYLQQNQLFYEGKQIEITCSIGVCEMLTERDSLVDLLSRAKSANDNAAKTGVGKFYVDQTVSETTQTVKFDMQWLPRIKSALMQNRFQLYQFPISSLHGESHEMLDVFLRMKDEVGDLVMPSVFLPVAERNNLIKSLDRWVIGAAIRFIEKNPNTSMFVRLSKASILDNNLLDWCTKVLSDYSVTSDKLVIQLPEAYVYDVGINKIKQNLDNYRSQGYGVALEHFGRDPGFMQLFNKLPVDYVKIDSTLIQGLTENKERQAVVKELCAVARESQISTIAEHVETANSMAMLYQLGADYMQGTFTLEPEMIIAAEMG